MLEHRSRPAGTGVGFVILAVMILAAPALAEIDIDGNADLQVIISCLQTRGQFTIFLRHLSRSGFQSVLGRYLGTQPITLLVPTDEAFRNLPNRLTGKLVGADRIKFIEFHMLRELWPAYNMREHVRVGGFWEAVLSDRNDGPFVYKCDLGDPDTLCLSSAKNATADSIAVVVEDNACGLPTRTIGVQIISSVLIPPGLLTTSTS